MRTADRDRLLARRAEIVAAARGALEAGRIAPSEPLSRRRRWQLLALDVVGDRAAMAAARRGKRTGLVVETHLFVRRQGRWEWDDLGPSLEYDDPTLPERGAHVVPGTTWAVQDAAWLAGATAGSVELWHLAAGATEVRTGGRTVPVGDHGMVVVLVDPQRRPVEVVAGDGTELGRLDLELGAAIPRRARALMWWHRRRRPDDGGWINLGPGPRPR